MRKLLDAAAAEFGKHGFHEASISGITRSAGIALGSFYTYFDSKEAILGALVDHLSAQVAVAAAAGVTPGHIGVPREREALSGFLAFVREHKELYRIIEESEFATPAHFRAHYDGTAARIASRFDESVSAGKMAPGDNEVRAWAVMGMNVFLGMRYGVWSEDRSIQDIVTTAEALLRWGLERAANPDIPIAADAS